MKYLSIVCMGAMMFAAGGCATKNYVRKSIDPVNGKVDAQGQQIAQTGQSLSKTQHSLEADETVLSATKETANSADARAGDALNKAGDAANRANEAAGKADQASMRANEVGTQVGDLSNRVANLDDYKKVSTATVNFKFASDKLDADGKQQLDQMAAAGNNYKRYFIAVEGFTDRIGNDAYNFALSRRRADAVVAYLVTQHSIPVYRIQMIGLGKEMPADDGKDKAARAKNRRVEVSVFSADPNASPMARN